MRSLHSGRSRTTRLESTTGPAHDPPAPAQGQLRLAARARRSSRCESSRRTGGSKRTSPSAVGRFYAVARTHAHALHERLNGKSRKGGLLNEMSGDMSRPELEVFCSMPADEVQCANAGNQLRMGSGKGRKAAGGGVGGGLLHGMAPTPPHWSVGVKAAGVPRSTSLGADGATCNVWAAQSGNCTI